METRAHYVAVGAFVVAIVFLAFGAVLWLGRVELSQDFAKYYIFFRGSVAGLSKGSTVQYNGIPVGRVIDIRVDPDIVEQIQVTVEIDRSLVTIKTDARAYLDTNILSGVSAIQIRGGTTEAADLMPEPGHKYPVIQAGRSELEQVKASLPELLGSLKEAAQSLDILLNEQNRQAIAETLANLRTVSAAAVEQRKGVSEVVANANASLVQLAALLRSLEQNFSARGGLKDQVAQTLGDYDRVARNLAETIRQLQVVIQENRGGLRGFSQRTLPDIGDLVAGAQQLVGNLNRFVSELQRDPTRLLFGDRREGYRPR
jgi:phospholipid/cholesterol/gamma-HCH transport system substrate-binding protein